MEVSGQPHDTAAVSSGLNFFILIEQEIRGLHNQICVFVKKRKISCPCQETQTRFLHWDEICLEYKFELEDLKFIQ
jgi:hypothetical protein